MASFVELWEEQQGIRQRPVQAPAGVQRNPNEGKGGLSAFISELGGAGGAAGGAALGTAILPGVGTLAGGLLGGLLGGTTGKAVEQKVRDDQDFFGEGGSARSAFTEGAFEGGAALLPGVGKGIKLGTKAVARKAAGETAERFATKQLGKAWGIDASTKIGGQTLKPQGAKKLQNFVIDELNVPKTADAFRVSESATSFADEIGSNISKMISDTKGVPNISDDTVNFLKKSMGEDITKPKSVKEAWDLRRVIDKELINWNRGAQSAVPGAERIARAARKEIQDEINRLAKGVKSLNSKYGKAIDVAELASSATKSSRSGVNLPGTLGRMGGEAGQFVRSRVGQGARSIGRGGNLTPTSPRTTAAFAGLGGALNASGQQPSTLEEAMLQSNNIPSTNSTNIANNIPPAMSNMGSSIQNPQAMSSDNTITNDMVRQGLLPQDQLENVPQQSTNPFDPVNLESTIMQILEQGGDYGDITDAIKISQAIQEVRSFGQPEQIEQKPLSGEVAKRALTAQSGLRSLDTLFETLESDPGAFQRQALPNPFGITGRLTGTTGIRAATDNVVDVIARLRSGAAITDSEAARFARQLPQPGDSEDEALRKLQNVYAELSSFANPQAALQQQVSSTPQSLEQALLAQQGAF